MEPRTSPIQQLGLAAADPEFNRYADRQGMSSPERYAYLRQSRPDTVLAAEREIQRSFDEDDDEGWFSTIRGVAGTVAKIGLSANITFQQSISAISAAAEQAIFGAPEAGEYRPAQDRLLQLSALNSILQADENIRRGNESIQAIKDRKKNQRGDVDLGWSGFNAAADFSLDIYDYVGSVLEASLDDPGGVAASVGSLAAQAAPSMAVTIGATALGGPALGVAVGAAQEIGGQLSDAMLDPDTGTIREMTGRDAAAALLSGTVAGGFEALGGKLWVKTIGRVADAAQLDEAAKKVFKRTLINEMSKIAKAGGSEGMTEAFQQVIANAGARFGWDPDRAYTEGVGESFVAGLISSGGLSAATSYANRKNRVAPDAATIRDGLMSDIDAEAASPLPTPAADPAMVQQLEEEASQLTDDELTAVVENAADGDVRGDVAADELLDRDQPISTDPDGAADEFNRPQMAEAPVFEAQEKPQLPPVGQDISDALAKDLEKYVRDGGDITAEEAQRHPRVLKAYLAGAPQNVNSIEDHNNLLDTLRKFGEFGNVGTEWYENSGKALLELTRNPNEAKLLAQLIAITSPQNPVPQNWDDALKIYNKWKAADLKGERVEVDGGKTGDINRRAEAVLYEGKNWDGLKTNSFYNNIVGILEGRQDDDVTVDLWVMRALGYDSEQPTAAQYRYARRTINDIAKENGLLGRQVQAQIWVAVKHLREVNKIEDPTVKDLENLDPGEVDSVDYSTVAGWREGQVSAEIVPGESTGFMPGAASAPNEILVRMTDSIWKAFHDESGNNILMDAFGILGVDEPNVKVGFYKGDTNPVMQVRFQAVKGKGRSEAKDVKMGPTENVVFKDAARSAVLKKFRTIGAAKEALGTYIRAQAGDADAQAKIDKMRLSNAVRTAFDQQIEKQQDKIFEVDPATRELAAAFASAIGELTLQEAVPFHRPVWTARPQDANGVDIQLEGGREATIEEVRAIAQRIESDFPESGGEVAPITTTGGFRLIKFDGMLPDIGNQEWYDYVNKVVEETISGDAQTRHFGTDSEYIYNDWEVNPNGEGYRARVSLEGRPDIQRRVYGTVARQVAQNYKRYAQRYGLDDPSKYDRLIDKAREVELGDQIVPNEASPNPLPSDVAVGQEYADTVTWMSQQDPDSDAYKEYASMHAEGRASASQKQMAVMNYGDLARADEAYGVDDDGARRVDFNDSRARVALKSDQDVARIANDPNAHPQVRVAAYWTALDRGLDTAVEKPPVYSALREYMTDSDLAGMPQEQLAKIADRSGIPDARNTSPVILLGRLNDSLYSGSVVDTIPASATRTQALDHIAVHSQNRYELLYALGIAREEGTQTELYQKLEGRYVEMTGTKPSSMDQRSMARLREHPLYQRAQLSENLPSVMSGTMEAAGINIAESSFADIDALADDILNMGMGETTSFPDAVAYLGSQEITFSDQLRMANELRKAAEQKYQQQKAARQVSPRQGPSVFGPSFTTETAAGTVQQVVGTAITAGTTRKEYGVMYSATKSMFEGAKSVARRLTNSGTCK